MKQGTFSTQKYKLKLLPYQYLALRILKYSLRELKDFLISESRNEFLFEIPNEIKSREIIASKTLTLKEYLLHQLRLEPLSEFEVIIGEELIGNLNDDGYLTTPVEEIAKNLNTAHSEVEKILHIIQEFDPSGVGARSLSECLLIQLKIQNKMDSLEYKIVKDYLKELGSKKFELISKKLKTDGKNISEAAARITKLNPKPGSILRHLLQPYFQI